MTLTALASMTAAPPTSARVAPTQAAGGSDSMGPPSLANSTILTCSTPAQLMAKMRQLAVTDPEEFKLLAAEMGTRFQGAAGESTGQDAQLLAKVSAQFQQAAWSGALEPSCPSSTSDGAKATPAVTSTAAQSGTEQGDGRPSLFYSRDPRGITRASWESPAVQQAFSDALAVFSSATGDET